MAKTKKPDNITKDILVYAGNLPIACASKAAEDGKDPVQLFKKDMIKVGVYTHPVWEWTLDVTEERLYKWAAAFQKMKENGVDVEIPLDHSIGAADNLGYVKDMFVELDGEGVPTLFGVHEIRGEDAIDVVKRNKNVSVFIDRDYKDGQGNSYGEAITHSSVVQQPIVAGQDEFVPIAASRLKGEGYSILTLSQKEGTKMDEKLLKQFRELLGASDDLTEDNIFSRVEERLSSLTSKTEELEKTNTSLQGKVDALASKVKASVKNTTPIDKNLAEQMGATADQQLDLLVESGKITPAVKEKLSLALVGASGSRNTLALSIREENKPSIFTEIITALKENDVVKLGEQTGAQVLSHAVPDANTDEDVKETTDEMVEMVDGKTE